MPSASISRARAASSSPCTSRQWSASARYARSCRPAWRRRHRQWISSARGRGPRSAASGSSSPNGRGSRARDSRSQPPAGLGGVGVGGLALDRAAVLRPHSRCRRVISAAGRSSRLFRYIRSLERRPGLPTPRATASACAASASAARPWACSDRGQHQRPPSTFEASPAVARRKNRSARPRRRPRASGCRAPARPWGCPAPASAYGGSWSRLRAVR